MNFEDHFSELAETYSKYRPGFPPELFDFLSASCKDHNLAWDCGTGNGQAALELTKYFEQVYATDASAEQIEHASYHPKIIYRVEPAESVSLDNSIVDLITVSVAVHWFDFDRFYREVRRVLQTEGIIAVWTYNLLNISPDIDLILDKYMNQVLKEYWPERFYHISTAYTELPFPFQELQVPEFKMTTNWDLNQVAGFLNSWSGTRNYINKKGLHPLNEIWDDLKKAWGDEKTKYTTHWPLHIRIGRV